MMRMIEIPTKKPSTAMALMGTVLAESATISVMVATERNSRVVVLYYPSSALLLEHPELVAEMTRFLALSCSPKIHTAPC